MNEEIQALIADLFDQASAHSQIVAGDSLTDDDEAFSANATPEKKLAVVRDYLRDSYCPSLPHLPLT